MHFPIYLDLSDKEILIVGAGAIAARRVRTLCGFAGHMTVVAPKIAPTIRGLALGYPITILQRKFESGDLEGKFLVLAATDDSEQNRCICELCRQRGILVNVCSDQTLCDFQFPSIVQKDDLVIGINASGKNHGLVKRTRQELEAFMQVEETEHRYED